MTKKIPAHILPVIVLSQFAGTSLWFAGNAVVPDLIDELNLLEAFIGFVTMAVQSGFIAGTLVFAALSIADRFSPVKVFLICALLGGACNLMTIYSTTFTQVMLARLFTGFFLAGIYPVGMKIASDWHEKGLGKALGYLVGALVLGTAFPHLLKYLGGTLPWRYVLVSTSIISAAGGVLMYLTVNDGPFRGRKGTFQPAAMFRLFRNRNFRSAAFGYFGHMWELYTFWTFVPVMLAAYLAMHDGLTFSIPLLSFFIIGAGSLSCVAGGYLSLSKGSKHVSVWSLILSGSCVVLLPLLFGAPPWLFLGALMVWGLAVIPDSPQFSTLVAGSAERSYVATGLTIVNSLGFALTIVSIQVVNFAWIYFEDPMVFWLMLPGPLLGLMAITRYKTIADLSKQ